MSRVRNRTRGPIVVIGIVGLAVIALSLLGLSGLFPRADGKAPSSSGSAATTPAARPSSAAPLARSVPTRLAIAAIDVDSTLQQLGMSKDDQHTMELPPDPKRAGWYKLGPTPGQPGPTIIEGYIDSPHGPGVFDRLAALRKNDPIEVTRADGRIVSYRVDKIASYTKSDFPTSEVYTSSPAPTLRLITCGGTLHRGQKAGNVVVFAHQVSIRRPAPLRPQSRTAP